MRIIKLISLFKPKSIYRILRGLDIMSKQKIKTEVIQSIISDMKSISTYLEIGVEQGLNITRLAKNNINISFIGLDPYTSESFKVKGEKEDAPWANSYNTVLSEFEKRTRKINNIRLIRDYSDSAVTLFEDKSIDFVFIDGSHDYTSVVKDINNYLPKVAPGGVIGGHDYNLRFFGVVNAVNDTLGYDNVSIRSDYTWFYFKKHE